MGDFEISPRSAIDINTSLSVEKGRSVRQSKKLDKLNEAVNNFVHAIDDASNKYSKVSSKIEYHQNRADEYSTKSQKSRFISKFIFRKLSESHKSDAEGMEKVLGEIDKYQAQLEKGSSKLKNELETLETELCSSSSDIGVNSVSIQAHKEQFKVSAFSIKFFSNLMKSYKLNKLKVKSDNLLNKNKEYVNKLYNAKESLNKSKANAKTAKEKIIKAKEDKDKDKADRRARLDAQDHALTEASITAHSRQNSNPSMDRPIKLENAFVPPEPIVEFKPGISSRPSVDVASSPPPLLSQSPQNKAMAEYNKNINNVDSRINILKKKESDNKEINKELKKLQFELNKINENLASIDQSKTSQSQKPSGAPLPLSQSPGFLTQKYTLEKNNLESRIRILSEKLSDSEEIIRELEKLNNERAEIEKKYLNQSKPKS